MSSNTLRGIGQEGGGEEGEDGQDGRDGRDGRDGDDQDTAARSEGVERVQGQSDAKKLFDGLQQLRNVRSLDSTVPGTRSLDSSVPNAQPSLDAKVPSLAATMMGVPAPAISGREQGTVQGRDVHLPVEIQRMAGMRPVARAHDAVPDPVEHSEPTLADPVQAAPLPESAGESIHGHVQGHPQPHPDLNSHAPWYEQEPNSEGIYDDPKPSALGRVAIGVAVVAALSVVLFVAAIRVRARNAASQQAETTVPEPPTLIVSTPVPDLIPPPPLPDPAVSPGPATAEPNTGPPSPPALGMRSTPPVQTAPPVAPPSTGWQPGRTASLGRPPAVASAVPPRSGASNRQTVGQSNARTTAATTTRPAATTAVPMTETTTQPTAAGPSTPPSAAEGEPPSATPPAAKYGAPEKARGKPYDPDSTLPLNID